MAPNDATGEDSTDRTSDEYGRNRAGRRSFLKLVGTVGVAAGLGGSMAGSVTAQAADLSGSEIGGGSAYGNLHTDGDYTVSSLGELESALGSAQSGDVVFADGNAEIDVTGEGLSVPSGVTLASDRGVDGSNGARFVCTSPEIPGPIEVAGTVGGIELQGPKPDFTALDDRYPSGHGFEVADGGEVANCDVHHFGDGAITVDGSRGAHVHHSVVRDCAVEGIGYGIRANAGGGLDDRVVIEYCHMYRCRHEIAAHGPTGYVVRHNVFDVDDFANPSGNLMQQDIDDHGSGAVHEISNNTFRETGHDCVSWRESVDPDSEIHHNWFHHAGESDALDSNVEISNVYENHYGSSSPPSGVGARADGDGDGGDEGDDGDRDEDLRRFEIQTASGADEVTYEFTVDGSVVQAPDDVENNDEATEDGGTWTATGATGNGYADAWDVGGELLDVSVSNEDVVTLVLGGTDVTDEYLGADDGDDEDGSDEGDEADRFEIQTASDGDDVTYEFTVDGTVAQADVESNDEATENGDGTWTAVGKTGNGYADAWDVGGELLDVSVSNEDVVTLVLDGTDVTDDMLGTDDGDDGDDGNDGDDGDDGSDLPNEIVFDGRDSDRPTTYSFTVTESIEPAGDSLDNADTITEHTVEGELPSDDVDRYRYSGALTAFDANGPASVTVKRGE